VFRSIRWRIGIVFAVLIIACIGGLGAYLSHLTRSDHLDTLRTQLTDQAWLVGDLSAPYFAGNQTESLEALAQRLGEQIGARITIIDKNGVVLADSEEDPATLDNHANRPEVIDALSKGTGSSIRYSATLHYNMMYVAVTLTSNGGTVGIARVALPLTQIDKSLEHVNQIIIIGAVIAAVIAILLAFQILRITTGPVKKLTQLSKKMAEGELDQEIQITSRDEVGELARAFNQMAARLKEMVALVTNERDMMATILSNIDDAIFMVDRDSKVTTMNQAAERISQTQTNKALGHTFIEVVRDHELNEVLQHCLSTREQQTGAVEIKPQKQLLSMIATPLSGDSGCLVHIRDLTELRRLEMIRQDFISNISHELRTPIASVKALAETLNEGAIEDPSVAKDFLSRINVEADKLAQMVQELGELSRIESREAPLQKRHINMADAIEHAVDRLRAQSDRAGLNLDIDIPPTLPKVMADEARVEQVLVNLIHNAIKFTPSGGRISISAKVKDNFILVSVSDTGVGIPADDLPRIFERFYKADKSRSGGGTGLGLAIAKHIVEAHGGRIWAESTEGRGSTFNFTLPLTSRV
jgi:two-component system, OmpR family, phosphate regulon sensor histidine kinase PhoR